MTFNLRVVICSYNVLYLLEKTQPAMEQPKEVEPEPEPVKISEEQVEPLAPKEVPVEEDPEPVTKPVKLEDKAIQNDSVPLSAKVSFFIFYLFIYLFF